MGKGISSVYIRLESTYKELKPYWAGFLIIISQRLESTYKELKLPSGTSIYLYQNV